MLLNERNFLRAATLFQPKSYIYDYYMQVKLKRHNFTLTDFRIFVTFKQSERVFCAALFNVWRSL